MTAPLFLSYPPPVELDDVQAGGGGAGGALARAGLSLVALGWGAAWGLKEFAYRTGLRRPHPLAVPVVSVGNLAVGGTGKTPFVAWLARRLQGAGHHPGILSRGYGPDAADSTLSDEGAVLDALLEGSVPQVEDPHRRRGGQRLLEAHPDVDVVLLDDGFQHRRIARDLDLVLLDATNPFGYGHLLPRGRLREPPRALGRAGIVVLSRAERVDAAERESLRRAIGRHTEAPLVIIATRPIGVEVGGRQEDPGFLKGRAVFVASGIGNPAAFVAMLDDLGVHRVGRRDLADHAEIEPEAWAALVADAKRAGAELVVITRKDAVKRRALAPEVAILDIGLEVLEGEAAIDAALARALKRG